MSEIQRNIKSVIVPESGNIIKIAMSGKRKAAEIDYLQKKLRKLQKRIESIEEDSDSSVSVSPEEEDQREEIPSENVIQNELIQTGKKIIHYLVKPP